MGESDRRELTDSQLFRQGKSIFHGQYLFTLNRLVC